MLYSTTWARIPAFRSGPRLLALAALAGACLLVSPAANASSFLVGRTFTVNVNSPDWADLLDPDYVSTGWAQTILNGTTLFQQSFSLSDLPDSWTLTLTPGVGPFDAIASQLYQPDSAYSGTLNIRGEIWNSGTPADFWAGSGYLPGAIMLPYTTFAGDTITEIDITLAGFSTGRWTSPVNGNSGPSFNFSETITIKGVTGTVPASPVPEPSSAGLIVAGVVGLAVLPASRKYWNRVKS